MKAAMVAFGRAVLGAEAFSKLSSERMDIVHANAIRAELLGSGFLPLKDEQIRSIHMPTLLVLGANSPSLFHRLTDALMELLAHADRVVIEGASHIMHEDNPATYNREVMDFLARAVAA